MDLHGPQKKKAADRDDDKRIDSNRKRDLIKGILKDARGREFIWMLIEAGRPFDDPYTGNSYTYYACGYSRNAKELIELCKEASFSLYQQMELEAHQRAQTPKSEE